MVRDGGVSIAYVGELSFTQSFGLVMRQRGVVVTLTFAAPIETAGRTRREVTALAEGEIASHLGLPKDRTPRPRADLLAAPRGATCPRRTRCRAT